MITNKDMPKQQDAKKILKELKEANNSARDFLISVDKRIAEFDIKYAKTIIEQDMKMLNTAKKIIEERKKLNK